MKGEKGVDVLLAAAARLPGVPVRLAGNGPILDTLMSGAAAQRPLYEALGPEAMASFYQGARFLVVPSMWFEGCPLVVSEAMSHGLPVIASRIGGLPEFVEDGVTGLLFEPGNAAELADKIHMLWENPDLCRRLGEAGRKKANREYGAETYYQHLMSIYDKAIELTVRQRPPHERTPLRSDGGETMMIALRGERPARKPPGSPDSPNAQTKGLTL